MFKYVFINMFKKVPSSGTLLYPKRGPGRGS